MREPIAIDMENRAIVPRSDYGNVQKYCVENDVKMPIVDGIGMVTEEIYEDGFLIRPLWLETKPIPEEGIELVKGLYEAGVEFEGFFVVHETPWSFMEDRPQVTLEQARQVIDSRSPTERSSATVGAIGLGLALALGVVVLGALFSAATTPAPSLPTDQRSFRAAPHNDYYLDPLLVGVLHNSGRRVVCYAWLDEF